MSRGFGLRLAVIRWQQRSPTQRKTGDRNNRVAVAPRSALVSLRVDSADSQALALRRQPRAWNKLRLIVVLVGSALAAVGTSSSGRASLIAIVGGLVLMFFALVVLPERPRLSVDARSRELGALVVVKGGSYHASGAWTDSLLFVGPNNLSLVEETSLRRCSRSR